MLSIYEHAMNYTASGHGLRIKRAENPQFAPTGSIAKHEQTLSFLATTSEGHGGRNHLKVTR
jgi:hypothetical protein